MTAPSMGGFDSTLAFLRDPYGFISKRCREEEADLFETRLRLEKVVCLSGKEAARLFYDEARFRRRDAAPKRIQKTLFGQGGVQGLDGEAHRHRKKLFMELVAPERVAELAERSRESWRRAAANWEGRASVVLADEAREVLTRAVCAWAEVPLPENEVEKRTRDLSLLFDGAGAVGLKHWRARRARRRANRWAREMVEGVRLGRIGASMSSAVRRIALFRDEHEELLDPEVAAVELLNLLRPTVAVSVYVTFVALALRDHPECLAKARAREDGFLDAFAQEVRRFYPFFPVVAARARRDFEWRGYRFPEGRLVLLDLYGTNHDERLWEDPDVFNPERFRRRAVCPFSFVPQGGGDPHRHHRCPGEGIATELMKVAADFLANDIEYTVPDQDLEVDRRRLPALPRSGFVMTNVRCVANREECGDWGGGS